MSSVKGLSWGSCLRTELLAYCPSSLTIQEAKGSILQEPPPAHWGCPRRLWSPPQRCTAGLGLAPSPSARHTLALVSLATSALNRVFSPPDSLHEALSRTPYLLP